MRIDTELGVLRDAPPVSYQMIDGERVPVESRLRVLTVETLPRRRYCFAVGAYRADRGAVIDPGLEYSTFLGGVDPRNGGRHQGRRRRQRLYRRHNAVAELPDDRRRLQTNRRRQQLARGLRHQAERDRNSLIYSTFIGGNHFEWGRAIAIDAAGNAYVTGQTKSTNFPTTGGAFDRTFNVDTCPRCGIDQYDAFVSS